MNQEYNMCSYCIMDNASDSTILFNSLGQCNYCTRAKFWKDKLYFPNKEGQFKLHALIEKIKRDGVGKDYDCIMGISGGLDSSYLAYLGAKKWGLRIFAVHIDDGFNEPITIKNLQNLTKECNIELFNIKPDEVQFNSLTKAYIKAGVPNIAIPQDSILFAFLYKMARKHKLKYFLSGSNFALENIIQKGNTHTAFDTVNIKDINKKFGSEPIDKLPILSTLKMLYDKNVLKIQTVQPLNLINYDRESAIRELEENCSFTYYGSKHTENTLTKFIQLYYFPKKFNVDKRRSHLSSLIVSGQMTRDEALTELEKPLYDEKAMDADIDMIMSKLDMSREELEFYMNQRPMQHTDYKTSIVNMIISAISKYRISLRNRKANRK